MKYISGVKVGCETRDSLFIKNGIKSEELRNFPIILDIFDTLTKQTNKVAFQELEGNEFGRVEVSEGVYLISVDSLLWNFLDYVDKPKEFKRSQLGIDASIEKTEIMHKLGIYTVSPKQTIFILRTLINLRPLDSNCIFWAYTNGGGRYRDLEWDNIYIDSVFSILQIYELMIQCEIPLESNIEIYYNSGNSTYYRLFLNNKIIRFLTKLITLRR